MLHGKSVLHHLLLSNLKAVPALEGARMLASYIAVQTNKLYQKIGIIHDLTVAHAKT